MHTQLFMYKITCEARHRLVTSRYSSIFNNTLSGTRSIGGIAFNLSIQHVTVSFNFYQLTSDTSTVLNKPKVLSHTF